MVIQRENSKPHAEFEADPFLHQMTGVNPSGEMEPAVS